MGLAVYVETILATMDSEASLMITTKGYFIWGNLLADLTTDLCMLACYMSEILSSTFLHYFLRMWKILHVDSRVRKV